MDNQTTLTAVKQIIYYAIGVVKLANEFPVNSFSLGRRDLYSDRKMPRQGSMSPPRAPCGSSLWTCLLPGRASDPRHP